MAAPDVTGTATAPYQPVTKQDVTGSITLHFISAMPQFENRSPRKHDRKIMRQVTVEIEQHHQEQQQKVDLEREPLVQRPVLV